MTKEFKIIENGNLQVTVDTENKVFIPVDGEKQDVGNFTQKTVQNIDKDKIHFLKKYILEEKDKVDKQLEQLEKQFEPIKNLQDISEDIMKQCRHAIQKGTKPFKESMKPLAQRIVNLEKKNTLILQIEYLKKQQKEVNADLNSLNKVFK